jgi:hypothetical protein
MEGMFANAGLKYSNVTAVDNGDLLYKHCRSDAFVVIRQIKTIVIGTEFCPTLNSRSGFALASGSVHVGCRYSYAVSGRSIGYVEVDRYCTVAGLHALIVSEMKRNNQMSKMAVVKMAFAEMCDDGSKISKNTILRNCIAVQEDLKVHAEAVPPIRAFLSKPAISKKKLVIKQITKKPASTVSVAALLQKNK